ncbi:unnamed protein product, partial [Ectocarpus sp. 13 AM-2016]
VPIDLFRAKPLQTPLKHAVASGNLFDGQPRRRGSWRRSSVLAARRLLENQQPVEQQPQQQLKALLLPMRRMPTGGRRIDRTAFLDTRNRALYTSERREVSVRVCARERRAVAVTANSCWLCASRAGWGPRGNAENGDVDYRALLSLGRIACSLSPLPVTH